MDYTNQLNTAITLTRRMLGAAKEGGWEEVIQLEERRRPLLSLMEKIETDSMSAVDSGVIEGLQILISLNEELSELGSMEKSECFSRFLSNKKNKKAFNAYNGY